MAENVDGGFISPQRIMKLEQRVNAHDQQLNTPVLPNNANLIPFSYTAGPTANSENSVDHVLNRVPNGFIITSVDRAAHIYAGTTPHTASKLFLRSDTAGAVVSGLIY